MTEPEHAIHFHFVPAESGECAAKAVARDNDLIFGVATRECARGRNHLRTDFGVDVRIVLMRFAGFAELFDLDGYEMEMNRVFGFGHKRRFLSYGQPRAGNSHWARKFNQIFPNAIRVTHADDPVPHIAPCHADPSTQRCIEIKDRKKRLWAFHAPTQVWYPGEMPAIDSQNAGQFTVCKGDNWGEDEACRSHPLGFSMEDHVQYFGHDVARRCEEVLSELEPAATTPAQVQQQISDSAQQSGNAPPAAN